MVARVRVIFVGSEIALAVADHDAMAGTQAIDRSIGC